MTYPTLPNCQCDHKGSKFIVPLHLLNLTTAVDSPKSGFVKLYFKNNVLTSKYSNGTEKNLVLDTLLTGLVIAPGVSPILTTDSIIQAFGKLQGTINNLAGGVQADWNEADPLNPAYIQNKPIIPTDISDLTDNTNIIPVNTSDLTNDSGFITLGDIPTIPSDISDLTDNTGIIPTATSDLTNDSNFIVIGDVPNTIVENSDVDATNIAIGKTIQVGADGVTHEYVDMPSGGLDKTFQTLTEAATITFDAATSVNGSVILTASRNAANFINPVVGEEHTWRFVQGGTGSYGITWGNQYKASGGVIPGLSATVGAVDLYTFKAISATEFVLTNVIHDYKAIV
jgi:hypothetical protein